MPTNASIQISLPLLAIAIGLYLLLWSADKFVSNAALVARKLQIPAVLIGMIIVGFGTSMPEIVISAVAANNGNPGLALGNAYGSNIANIALILGITAVIVPIKVESGILKQQLPILLVITLIASLQMLDSHLSFLDGIGLILIFMGLMTWSIRQGLKHRQDAFAQDIRDELDIREKPLSEVVIQLIVGILVLVISSRIFVWGAVDLAKTFGVSELIIGLTVVALGTSLPELVSSIMAIKKNEHDLALGNILGSNLFNTLTVVGIAGVIQPFQVPAQVLYRDLPVMVLLTVALYLACYQFRDKPFITRWEGGALLAGYISYTYWLFISI